MNRIFDWSLRHRKAVLIVAAVCLIAALLCMPLVRVNYDMAQYLPADAPSTRAMQKMAKSGAVPNIQVMIKDVSLAEAGEAKRRLGGIPSVESVMWLGDVADLAVPLTMQDAATTEGWYKDGCALYMLTCDVKNCVAVVDAVRGMYPDASLSGDAVNQAMVQSVSMGEISSIMLYVVPIVLLILLLSTGSWAEPVLFLAAIGAAILLNEGSNVILGEISYVTQACSAILQLAVSIDYAVFLLHRFSDEREKGLDATEAMRRALKQSSSAIAASALTTVSSFLALIIMNFKIGADMGIVLAKSITLSYLSVMLILPALALSMTKLIDKTRHKMLLPSFKRTGRVVTKFAAPIAVLLILLIVPGYLAKDRVEFVYGSSGMHAADSQVAREANEIAEVFGNRQQVLLMVPQGQPATEKALCEELKTVRDVVSVTSYATAAGVEIPDAMLSPAQLEQLRSDGVSRVILYVDTPDEGARAFAAVESIKATAAKYYGDAYDILGASVVNDDLKTSITGDSMIVQLTAVAAIFLILLLTFKSLSIPFILLLVIEGAVWINVSFPYFTGDTLNYIGYQIICSVQLGATIDYGILMAQQYLEQRKTLSPREAAGAAVGYATRSILPSALILIAAGAALGVISSNGIVSQMGSIFARGAAISAVMVILLLPALLMALDKLIKKTTLPAKGEQHDA